MRLNAIAVLRPNTIPNRTPANSSHEKPWALVCQASAALRSANGKANNVWLKRIISSIRRMLCSICKRCTCIREVFQFEMAANRPQALRHTFTVANRLIRTRCIQPSACFFGSRHLCIDLHLQFAICISLSASRQNSANCKMKTANCELVKPALLPTDYR
jgi:hypothetical protein